MRAALLLPVLAAACTDHAPPPSDGPPIVLIVIDTLRADHLGIYGHHRPTSPNIDALARDGTWFRRAYAHSSWTLASMVSLLTGKLPHEHRVVRDPVQTDRFGRLPDGETTLAESLTAAGYRCGAVINNTFLAPDFGLHQGFERYDYQGATNEDIRSGDASVDVALRWIDAADDRPFFLLFHMMEPHLNYSPHPSVRGTFTGHGAPPVPLPFTDQIDGLQSGQVTLTDDQLTYVTGLYDEEILAADRAVGHLVAGLRERGQFENAVLVVTSDHGEEFFDHGSFEHGHSLYGEVTRVPLIAHGPGLGHGEVTALAQHLDLFQGLLALAGAPAPAATGGTDLFALAAGASPPSERHVICEDVNIGPPRTSITDGRHRLHVLLHTGATELWRLDDDGIERKRIRGAGGQQPRERLRKTLARRRGGLEPAAAVAGPSIPDFEAFEQLKSLGYVR